MTRLGALIFTNFRVWGDFEAQKMTLFSRIDHWRVPAPRVSPPNVPPSRTSHSLSDSGKSVCGASERHTNAAGAEQSQPWLNFPPPPVRASGGGGGPIPRNSTLLTSKIAVFRTAAVNNEHRGEGARHPARGHTGLRLGSCVQAQKIKS